MIKDILDAFSLVCAVGFELSNLKYSVPSTRWNNHNHM